MRYEEVTIGEILSSASVPAKRKQPSSSTSLLLYVHDSTKYNSCLILHRQRKHQTWIRIYSATCNYKVTIHFVMQHTYSLKTDQEMSVPYPCLRPWSLSTSIIGQHCHDQKTWFQTMASGEIKIYVAVSVCVCGGGVGDLMACSWEGFHFHKLWHFSVTGVGKGVPKWITKT